MKKIFLKLFIIVFLTSFSLLKGYCADIDLSKSYVSDKANILSGLYYSRLSTMLKNLHKDTGNDVVIVTLPSIPSGETYATIEAQIKSKYIIGGESRDRWVIIILTTDPYRLHIRVGKGLRKVITGATKRAMQFEFLFSRLLNENGNSLIRARVEYDLYNTTLFLAELIADETNARLSEYDRGETGEALGAFVYNLPRHDPTEKYIRRNNFHMVIAIIAVGIFILALARKIHRNIRIRNAIYK